MAAQLVRVAGKALQAKKVSMGNDPARRFTFLNVAVQTDVASIIEVRFTDDWEHETPRAGDLLDVDVAVGGYQSRSGLEINFTAVQPHTEDFFDSLRLQHLEAAA